MLCVVHTERDCIYDELVASYNIARYPKAIMNKQVNHYRDEGFPKHYGLGVMGSIFRQHNNPKVSKLMDDWWNEIIFDDKQNVFTRKDIVLFVANNDGGAHVDPELKESFALLTKYNSLGFTNTYGNSPLSNPIYQAVRVIAEEFLLSVTISSSGLKNRRQYKERKFEMRFIDDVRRYKWSTTDINCSNETMEIVNRHKAESRKLYRQEFGNGMAVEYIGK